MSQLWPRLSMGYGTVEFRKLGDDPAQLTSVARNRHPQATYAATGGQRVGEEDVSALAESIRSIAVEYGFPSRTSTADLVQFDRAAAESIHSAMDITAVEAGVRGIWTFLSVVALPDVTIWRFPGNNVERWIATDLTRHMFSRLWWQALTFATVRTDGSYDYSLLRALSESDLNQLTERRSIAGVTPLARSIARVLTTDQQEHHRATLRDATPRLRRLMAFIDFSSLTEQQLDDRVRAVIHASTADS